MKFLTFLTVLFIVALLCLPVFAASDPTAPSDPSEIESFAVSEIPLSSHMASWEVVCNLGTIHLYSATGVDSTGIVVIDNQLVNLTNATVYFYCPEYPNYTFSASRFSPVSYRADNYSNVVLDSSSVTQVSVNLDDYYDTVLSFVVIALFFVVLWGVLFK